jgi:hypothetical protein
MGGSTYFQQLVVVFEGGYLAEHVQARGTGDEGWKTGQRRSDLRVAAHQLAPVPPGECEDCSAVAAGRRPSVGV